MEMFQKEDVMPYMRGMWRDALMSICGVHRDVFSGKHQACPVCGGKDRFRWTDKLQEPGDGGAFCNMCGGDKGMGWLMKITGEPYSECVNILGRFLGKVPQEYVIKRNVQARRDTGFKHGKQMTHERCIAIMARTQKMPVTKLSRYECLDVDYFDVGVSPDGRETIVVPARIVYEDGPDSEFCNLLMIDEEGGERFQAGGPTLAAVSVIGSTDKSIYLVKNWIDGVHVHMSTGQEVWVCYTSPNIEIVAHRYKGNRELRLACLSTDRDSLCSAEERGLKVITPNGDDFKRGMIKQIFSATDLLNKPA